MRAFLVSIYVAALVTLVVTRAGGIFLPVAALMTLPVLYFSWREAAIYVFTLTLLWESALPTPLGTVAVPLTVAALGVQVLARHQLRAHWIGHVCALGVLQAVVTGCLGLAMPAHSVGGLLRQGAESLGQLLLALGLSFVWIVGARWVAKRRFKVVLEERLKDL